MATQDTEITDLLHDLPEGGGEIMERLFPLVYDRLRRIAHNALQGERRDHTLGTTGLVHEAYLKLVDQTRIQYRDRAHFFAIAARAMRQILVDFARARRAAKRDAGERAPLDEAVALATAPAMNVRSSANVSGTRPGAMPSRTAMLRDSAW